MRVFVAQKIDSQFADWQRLAAVKNQTDPKNQRFS